MKRLLWIIAVAACAAVVLWACHRDDPALAAYASDSPGQLREKGLAHVERGEADSTLLRFVASAGKYRPSMRAEEKNECASAANNAGYILLFGRHQTPMACFRLCDHEHYGLLTVEAIASDLGFKSRSNFTSVFKRITGLSPTEYRRQSLHAEGANKLKTPAEGVPIHE